MSKKKSFLIGSLPFENEQEAMEYAVQKLGSSLLSLPSGEIGEKTKEFPLGKRQSWIYFIIDKCIKDAAHFKLENPKDFKKNEGGFPQEYSDMQKIEPLVDPEFIACSPEFSLEYTVYLKECYQIFKSLKSSGKIPSNMKFQFGTTTGLSYAFFMFEMPKAMAYVEAFSRRISNEINSFLESVEDPDEILVLFEIPCETVMACGPPIEGFSPERSLISVVEQIGKGISSKIHFGVHLCFGDMNNKAAVSVPSLEPLTSFVNKIFKAWPAQTHPNLDFMHVPLAEGDIPPKVEPAFYQPLENLKDWPKNTTFVAGFVHEKRSEQELKDIMKILEEKLVGINLGVATACGLGRRSKAAAQELMDKMKLLADN